LDFRYQENKLSLMLTDEHFTRKALTVRLTFEDATVMATLFVKEEMNLLGSPPPEGADVVAPKVGTLWYGSSSDPDCHSTWPGLDPAHWAKKCEGIIIPEVEMCRLLFEQDSSILSANHTSSWHKWTQLEWWCDQYWWRGSLGSVHVLIVRPPSYYLWEREAEEVHRMHHLRRLEDGFRPPSSSSVSASWVNIARQEQIREGVTIKSFRAENAQFNANEFKSDL
jgi:hypothetical protein